MDFRRQIRRTSIPRVAAWEASRHPARGNGGDPARPLSDTDWHAWLRAVERKRRLTARHNGSLALPRGYVVRATYASFRLEGLDVAEADVAAALNDRRADRGLRSRQTQRLRNHAAILERMETALRLGAPLKAGGVVRWYTSVSCGLSTTGLDDPTMGRIDAVARRINSPQLRLQPAVKEIARLHAQVLSDPLVPSFNGILARLLLRYHLGRCALPPVVFDPATPAERLADEPALLPQLLITIDASYDAILAQRA